MFCNLGVDAESGLLLAARVSAAKLGLNGFGFLIWLSERRRGSISPSSSPMSSKWLTSSSALPSSEAIELREEDLDDLEAVMLGGEFGPGNTASSTGLS